MTARATGREMAMGESREMTERNREKVLKYRGEEGVRVFEEKAEQFAVGLLTLPSYNIPFESHSKSGRFKSGREVGSRSDWFRTCYKPRRKHCKVTDAVYQTPIVTIPK